MTDEPNGTPQHDTRDNRKVWRSSALGLALVWIVVAAMAVTYHKNSGNRELFPLLIFFGVSCSCLLPYAAGIIVKTADRSLWWSAAAGASVTLAYVMALACNAVIDFALTDFPLKFFWMVMGDEIRFPLTYDLPVALLLGYLGGKHRTTGFL